MNNEKKLSENALLMVLCVDIQTDTRTGQNCQKPFLHTSAFVTFVKVVKRISKVSFHISKQCYLLHIIKPKLFGDSTFKRCSTVSLCISADITYFLST